MSTIAVLRQEIAINFQMGVEKKKTMAEVKSNDDMAEKLRLLRLSRKQEGGE